MQQATAGTTGPRDVAVAESPDLGDTAARSTPYRSRAVGRRVARRPRRATWRAVVTVVLLGVLAAAVTVVLLQSAGIISWGFLGPTA